MVEVDLEGIARDFLHHAEQCRGRHEENIKERAEFVLRTKALEPLGIDWADYEFKGNFGAIRARRGDALYGKVVIEYEAAGRLDSKAGVSHAFDQATQYIRDQERRESEWGRYIGVILDGFKIGFVRFKAGAWSTEGPHPVTTQSVLKLVSAIRGLRKKPLKAELLNRYLGPQSDVGKAAIRCLYEGLVATRKVRVRMLFNDWRRVFEQACGYANEKMEGLEKEYEIKSDKPDYEALLFAIHSYYALVMKLIAAEVASQYGGKLMRSYFRTIEEAYLKGTGELREGLRALEDGGLFADLGIKGYLEADYFGWYLDAWSKDIQSAIKGVVGALSDFDPAPVEQDPEEVRDLLKRLYEYLVPREIRYNLGEYYTPDWLAEVVLDEIHFDGDPNKRFLDPACGSGTFLVLAIQRARRFAEDHFLERKVVLNQLLLNYVGFDLNPLAVIAARTNYLFALGDLIAERGDDDVEIPVYLADSVFTERRVTFSAQKVYTVKTTVGSFEVPQGVVDSHHLDRVLALVEECLQLDLPLDESRKTFSKRAKEITEITSHDRDSLDELFELFWNLEDSGENHIWASVIRNSFAPLSKGKFDVVAGNPPWIGWENLPEAYRKDSQSLWTQYGLVRGKSAGMGVARKELATLFVVVALQRYLNPEGRLGFLVPFTIFKSPANEGFRGHLTATAHVSLVHDLVELAPFEGATNRTSMILAEPEGTTTFPVRCVTWGRRKGVVISEDSPARSVIAGTTRTEMVLFPIDGESHPESPWAILPAGSVAAVKKVLGSSGYSAHAGLFTSLNGAFIVDLVDQSGRLMATSQVDAGHYAVEPVTKPVDRDLVYPLLHGKDLKPWCATPSSFIVLPVGPDGNCLSVTEMGSRYPRTLAYLKEFEKQLRERSGEPYKSTFSGRKTVTLEKGRTGPAPFYWLFNARTAISKYKVAWKDTAGKISGKGEFSAAVLEPVTLAPLPLEPPVPLHTIMFIEASSAAEAHYLCAVLNSSPVRLAVASYTMERHIATQVPKKVHIPDYDPRDPAHKRLSELSVRAHASARAADSHAVEVLQREIDETAIGLWGLNRAELKTVHAGLRVFEGEST
jgi:type I restriction-modification system DNA methylase subunit